MKTLEQVRKYLNSIPNINYGGCGLSAYAMYLWIKKNNPIEAKNVSFIYIYSNQYFDMNGFNSNRDVINSRSNYHLADSCSHVLIKYRGKYIDSNSLDLDLSNGYHCPSGIKIKAIQKTKSVRFIQSSLRYGCWNEEFNRKKYLPRIEKKLGITIDF